ncbi:MAG: hypothetical protein JXR23_09785, partial [Pontiellaceae bacterium]|nr:hypothetical protein [Pontiellaceae bacterium]
AHVFSNTRFAQGTKNTKLRVLCAFVFIWLRFYRAGQSVDWRLTELYECGEAKFCGFRFVTM